MLLGWHLFTVMVLRVPSSGSADVVTDYNSMGFACNGTVRTVVFLNRNRSKRNA